MRNDIKRQRRTTTTTSEISRVALREKSPRTASIMRVGPPLRIRGLRGVAHIPPSQNKKRKEKRSRDAQHLNALSSSARQPTHALESDASTIQLQHATFKRPPACMSMHNLQGEDNRPKHDALERRYLRTSRWRLTQSISIQRMEGTERVRVRNGDGDERRWREHTGTAAGGMGWMGCGCPKEPMGEWVRREDSALHIDDAGVASTPTTLSKLTKKRKSA